VEIDKRCKVTIDSFKTGRKIVLSNVKRKIFRIKRMAGHLLSRFLAAPVSLVLLSSLSYAHAESTRVLEWQPLSTDEIASVQEPALDFLGFRLGMSKEEVIGIVEKNDRFKLERRQDDLGAYSITFEGLQLSVSLPKFETWIVSGVTEGSTSDFVFLYFVPGERNAVLYAVLRHVIADGVTIGSEPFWLSVSRRFGIGNRSRVSGSFDTEQAQYSWNSANSVLNSEDCNWSKPGNWEGSTYIRFSGYQFSTDGLNDISQALGRGCATILTVAAKTAPNVQALSSYSMLALDIQLYHESLKRNIRARDETIEEMKRDALDERSKLGQKQPEL